VSERLQLNWLNKQTLTKGSRVYICHRICSCVLFSEKVTCTFHPELLCG